MSMYTICTTQVIYNVHVHVFIHAYDVHYHTLYNTYTCTVHSKKKRYIQQGSATVVRNELQKEESSILVGSTHYCAAQ